MLAILLHIEENVKRNVFAVTEKEKKETMADIFGTNIVRGLVDTEGMKEFNGRPEEIYGQ